MITLKTLDDANFAITGATKGCHKNNLWWQSWHHQLEWKLSIFGVVSELKIDQQQFDDIVTISVMLRNNSQQPKVALHKYIEAKSNIYVFPQPSSDMWLP